MQKTFISDLQDGMPVESTFLCSHKDLLKDKNGKPYLNLKLMDRTGLVEARVWERATHWVQAFEKLDYIQIKGNVTSFQNHLQVNLHEIIKLDPQQIDSTDFLPHTSQDVSKMYEELLHLCRDELKNPWVKKLILNILEDSELAPLFKKSPAAKSNHHGWVGGLLEHVLQLCKLGRDVLKHYPQINGDLVIAGLILHDFGKIEEITTDRYFDYTDKGHLVGHLIISVEILIKKTAQIPDFPEKILHHLEHIILSHHGHLEYGSPKEPMTQEALMVHHLDNMDSKLQAFEDVIAREPGGDPVWSTSGIVFKRPLYKKTQEDMEKSLGPKTSSPKPKKPQREPERKKHLKKPLGTNLGELLSEKMKNQS